MPRKLPTFVLAAVLLVALASCDAARPSATAANDPASSSGTDCTHCHGDPNRADTSALVRAAPPLSVDGSDGGAHLAHLRGGALRGPVDCAECHVVPTSTRHFDGKVDLAFGPLARSGGAQPVFAGGSCASVYCHGATLNAGGKATQPAWSGGAALDCQSCHGFPPPSHAATSTQCATCHPGTVKPDGSIDVALGNHIDGKVEVNGVHPDGWSDPSQHGLHANQDLASCKRCHGDDLNGGTTGVSCNACHASTGFATWQSNCTFCHGARTATYTTADLTKAAPPAGTQGETATTDRAVGAHQKHLAGGAIGKAVACTDCHAIPTDLSHLDGTARVTFGAGATRGGATPTWNGTGCAASYCHGGTLNAGGTNTAPVWTSGASQATCGTCHGAPPPAPHTTSTACGSCHAGYTATSVNLATHIDGKLDVATLTCTSCHGDPARTSNQAAPPLGTKGETATTTRAVGAHQVHLNGNAIGKAVACTECHTVPTSTSHSTGTVDLTWGTLAKSGGATPTWNGTSCANYCHGSTLDAGGTNTAPSWTGGSPQATCGTCHGAPPPAPHTTSTACGSCHAGYTVTTVNLSTHMNGIVEAASAHPAGWSAKEQHGYTVNRQGLSTCKSCHGTSLDGVGGTGPSCASCHQTAGITSWQTSCTFCHGDRTSGAANPPVDTQGGSAATNVSVGVHASHVNTAITAKIGCVQCHPDRTGSNVITDAAHIDGNGVAEVVFGALAKTGGVTPVYSRTSATSATCSSTYCHGNFYGGATTAAPSWTSSTQATCTTCHGAPPSVGADGHHSFRACGDCHVSYTSTSVNVSLHMNGVPDVGNRITSYSTTTHTCTNSCHSSRTWR